MAKPTKAKVSHLKTAKAEVRIQFRGRRMEVTVVLPPQLEQQLAFRLAAKRRFPNPRKKR